MIFTRESDKAAAFSVTREFGLGGCLCCPFNTDVNFYATNGKYVTGKVTQDFYCGKNYFLRCLQGCCCCKTYYDLKVLDMNAVMSGTPNKFDDKYQLEVSLCCCGPHFNCCGATPFLNDAIFNIYPYINGAVEDQPVGYIQKTYAPGGTAGAACCRCCFQYSNYLVDFPDNASVQDKATFVGAFVSTEYIHFERQGNNN